MGLVAGEEGQRGKPHSTNVLYDCMLYSSGLCSQPEGDLSLERFAARV